METLFATVAQVSFTIVGLFFVALTVDAETRDFWFSQKTRSRYVYLNLLIMLLPGFLSLARLVTSKDGISFMLPFLSFLLFFLFFGFSREIKQIKKEKSYTAIADFEGVLDLQAEIRLSKWILFFIAIWGGAALIIQSKEISVTLDYFFSGFLVLFSIVSILPVNVFLRVYSEGKHKLSFEKEISGKVSNSQDIPSQATGGERSLLGLFLILGAFLLGLFIKRE